MTPAETNQEENTQPLLQQGVFARIGGFAHRRRWLALILWVAVLAVVWTVASVAGDNYGNDFALPGTESQQAADLLAEHGAARAGDTIEIVLHDDGGLREPGVEQRVEDMLGDVAGLPNVGQVHSPYDAEGAIAEDGTIGYATVVLEVPSQDMPRPDNQRILDTAQQVEGDGLQAELGGDAARLLAEGGTGTAESVGLLAALVILVLMFGTVIAAGLPIIIALFAVGSTVGVIIVASHVFTIAE
jgi:RND superfamily putative drug exporter